MNTEKIIFEQGNKQVIQQGKSFFTRITENGETFESQDFNTLEKAKENLGIVPTTEENNKIIAEFLGKEYKDNYIVIGNWNICTQNPTGAVWEQCKFHSDWNWLMEVVEKIESFEDENRCAKFNVIIEQSFIEIIDCANSEEIVKLDHDNKKLATFLACVEFIKWYNLQKSYDKFEKEIHEIERIKNDNNYGNF